MKDTKPRVATCNRCSRVVLAALADGCRAAVDPTPLKFQDIRDVLIAGRDMYRILYMGASRKPWRLELVTLTWLKSNAAKNATYAASHGCGCSAMDATVFEEPEFPTHPPVAALDGPQGLSAVQDATPPRSSSTRPGDGLTAARCKLCGQVIPAGDINRFQIEWPVWFEMVHKTASRGSKRGFEKTYKGWGSERWTIHAGPGGCPTNGGSPGRTT